MLQIGKEWKLESPKNLEDAVADLKADHEKIICLKKQLKKKLRK